MIDLSTTMVLAAPRNDDTENIIRILVVIIMVAIGMIGNIAKAKTEAAEKKKLQEAKRAATKKRKEGASRSSGVTLMREEEGRLLDPSEKERSYRKTSLPESHFKSEPRKISAYTRGGFGEALADKPQKSSLERFIELKDVHVPRSHPQYPDDIGHDEKSMEDMMADNAFGTVAIKKLN